MLLTYGRRDSRNILVSLSLCPCNLILNINVSWLDMQSKLEVLNCVLMTTEYLLLGKINVSKIMLLNNVFNIITVSLGSCPRISTSARCISTGVPSKNLPHPATKRVSPTTQFRNILNYYLEQFVYYNKPVKTAGGSPLWGCSTK
jgi:hypothetical protein